eukprot:TRINITY_DN4081_c0_g1_i1.p1 TRINITY_DN4081_c0_g1~~TRINITY_DN4081_c0_g1_i1.p1  ORF type:complete len:694 (+),score=177.62 TRINITY_DN4081_c0_g1_i1:277-2082(+)
MDPQLIHHLISVNSSILQNLLTAQILQQQLLRHDSSNLLKTPLPGPYLSPGVSPMMTNSYQAQSPYPLSPNSLPYLGTPSVPLYPSLVNPQYTPVGAQYKGNSPLANEVISKDSSSESPQFYANIPMAPPNPILSTSIPPNNPPTDDQPNGLPSHAHTRPPQNTDPQHTQAHVNSQTQLQTQNQNQNTPNAPFLFGISAAEGNAANEQREKKLLSYRNKRSKRNFSRTVDAERSKHAQSRLRDENGQFLPGKMQKTQFLDLQNKLDNSEYECQQLRASLSQRDQEIDQMKKQLSFLMAQNEQNEIQKMGMASPTTNPSPSSPFPLTDIHVIREHKQKLIILQQLQHAIEERMARRGSVAEVGSGGSEAIIQDDSNIVISDSNTPSLSSPNSIPNPIIPNNVPVNESTYGLSPQQPQFMSPMAEITYVPSEADPSCPISPRKKKTMDVGAYYMYDPYRTSPIGTIEIAPPFREKIDFSKIQLRQLQPPPNIVEKARTEYYEREKQWEQQREQNKDKSDPLKPQKRNDGYLWAISPCIPEFSEKIDLRDQLTKLRKTRKGDSDGEGETPKDILKQTEDVYSKDLIVNESVEDLIEQNYEKLNF